MRRAVDEPLRVIARISSRCAAVTRTASVGVNTVGGGNSGSEDYKLSNWNNSSTAQKAGSVVSAVAAAVVVPAAAAPAAAALAVGLVAIAPVRIKGTGNSELILDRTISGPAGYLNKKQLKTRQIIGAALLRSPISLRIRRRRGADCNRNRASRFILVMAFPFGHRSWRKPSRSAIT